MNKNIKDYLHLYLGCSCEFSPQHKPSAKYYGQVRELPKSGTEVLMWVTEDDVEEVPGNVSIYAFAPDIKPILRPLSDMSEEEAIELVKINEWKQYGDHPHKREYRAYRNGFNEIVVSWGDSIREKNVPVTKEVFGFEQFRYLLSKHFDLFQLIESGLAIDKTKLNKEPNAKESDTTKV